MSSRVRTLAFAGLAACGSHASEHIGTVTTGAQEAFKQWCAKGRLEMESNLDELPKDSPARADENLLAMHCYRTTPEEYDPTAEDGWLAFDSKTEQLIWLVGDVHPSTAGDFLTNVLLPELDTDQRKQLDELVALARTGSKVNRRWDSPALTLQVLTYPAGGNQKEPAWDFQAMTSLMRKRR